MRSGTGGDEASIFAAEIFHMYQKFASMTGWRFEVLEISKAEGVSNRFPIKDNPNIITKGTRLSGGKCNNNWRQRV